MEPAEAPLKTETDLAARGVFDLSAWAAPDGFTPPRLLLQWHVTDRCNRACRHCYAGDAGTTDQPFELQRDVLGQYDAFLARRDIAGTINFTGGEPFLHPRFLDLLALVAEQKPRITFAVLSNGSLVDRPLARELVRLGCRFLQVSIEGDAETHAAVRGPDDLASTLAAVRAARRAGLTTLVSFTAHRGNAHAFPAAATLARRAGADAVWTDRLIPAGHGETLRDLVMEPAEFRVYLDSVARTARALRRRPFSRTRVRVHRALQHLVPEATCRPYRCTAGGTLVTLLADGSYVPCRRMPIVVGDARRDRLEDVFSSSPLFHALRSPVTIPSGCSGCAVGDACRGGLRCLAYAWHGTPFAPDPQCFLRRETLPEPGDLD